ncbi:MAG: ribosomal RNA small subunit methyltransferase A [Planctomycetes bacterium]|nr:ribosomal RNA small subunit methyltransferase A [Planctomycetota bacterium]
MNEPLEIPRTASQMRALCATRGLAPSRRFGQHFLIEPHILDLIARLAELEAGDIVLEVGTGLGTLTRRLAEVPELVVSVEIDSGLYALARDLLGNQEKVRLIHGDVLESKSSLNPEVCEKLDVGLVAPEAQRFKVVANLTYIITSPFLSALILRYGMPARCVFLVQRELAENLTAKPGNRSYSPLTILLDLLATVTIDRYVSRDVFWPKPKVESAVVCLESKNVDPVPAMRAYPLVRFLFSERRKSIAALLKKLPSTLGGASLKDEAKTRVLDQVGLSGRERAESLLPQQFLELDREISKASSPG